MGVFVDRSWDLVALSVVIAIVAATVSLWLAFHTLQRSHRIGHATQSIQHHAQNRRRVRQLRIELEGAFEWYPGLRQPSQHERRISREPLQVRVAWRQS